MTFQHKKGQEMSKRLTLIVTAGALGLLTACGSSGGSGGGTTPPSAPTYNTFADIEAAATAMDGRVSALTPTDRTTLPDGPGAQTATYNGFVRTGSLIDTGALNGRELTGQLTLTADFATDAISGSASNFLDDTDAAYAGTLTGAGTINKSPAAPSAASLTIAGDIGGFTSSIALDGEFGGATAEAISGSAVSTIGTTAVGLGGSFVAEQ
jgi:hypothetical protein